MQTLEMGNGEVELHFCEVLCKPLLKVGKFLKDVLENFYGPKSKEDEEPVKARGKVKRSPGGWWV